MSIDSTMEMKTIGNFFWISLLVAILTCNRYVNCAIPLKEIECTDSTKCFNHIPHDVPDNVTRIVLQDVKNVENIKKGAFDGRNWNKVKYLAIFKTSQGEIETTRKTDQDSQTVQYITSIEAYSMEKLTSLEELYIESNSFEGLDYGSFAGLGRLKVLSFKTCEHLMLENIAKAINGSETVPNLQTLSMTYINTGNGVNLDKDTLSAISSKPLQLLDMHQILVNNLQVKYFRGPIMHSLKIINGSGITLNQIDNDDIESLIFEQPQLLNISFITLPMGLLRFTKFPFDLLSNSKFPLDMKNTTILTKFESIDYSNINHLPLVLKNLTILLLNSKHEKWHTKNLILKGNNMRYLDVTIPCINSSLETIDLSYNGITFLRPAFCSCCFNLKKIELSYNQLHKMSALNSSLFSQIFNHYKRLEEIYLTSNELNSIPAALFQVNSLLEVIDLSHNRLEQVTFRLQHLKNLKLLNLQYNRITMLDITSLNNLKLFQPNANWHFDVRHNPVSCSKCDNLQTIRWLAESRSIIHSKSDLVCVNDNHDNFVPVDRNAVTSVQEICHRQTHIRNIILLGTFVPLVSIVLIIATTYSILKYRRYKQYALNMAEKIRLIQEDATGTKFVVFTIFSSDDEEFMSTYVYPPMNQCLQKIVGTNRDLVAYGDKQFRPGQPINDEIVRSLEQSSVIILILSKKFCTSQYCRMEFDHALRMNKPIILMLKEAVSEEEMVPSLCIIFRKNTRILWENHGNDYQLKTTWENVCTSILELVKIEQTHLEKEAYL